MSEVLNFAPGSAAATLLVPLWCRAVADQLPPYVQAEEPTLEDAYLYLTSREAVQ